MKKFKIFCSVAFLCAIVAVNVSLSGNISKFSESNSNVTLTAFMHKAFAEPELSSRTVKNYDLTIWLFGNNDSKMDADDCVKKDCALWEENGTCTFTY